MASKHESEYVNFEPASDEEEKPALRNATKPATEATTAPSASADPTVGGVTPTAPLTRADIYNQVSGGAKPRSQMTPRSAGVSRQGRGNQA